MVPMWMYPVAISCGNTFVLKLSEKVPSCGLRLTELIHEAGLPEGVLNTVVGDKEAVDEILTNPKVRAISFVGSTAVGEYIYHCLLYTSPRPRDKRQARMTSAA